MFLFIRKFNILCDNVTLIKVPTGSGKTKHILGKAKNLLTNNFNNKSIVISFSNTEFVKRSKIIHLVLNFLSWSFKTNGKYETRMELNTQISEPLRNTINLENVDSSRANSIRFKKTPHTYQIDRTSRNPKIYWDRGVTQGQKSYEFPILPVPTVKIEYLFIGYGFIKNSEFNLEEIMKIGYF